MTGREKAAELRTKHEGAFQKIAELLGYKFIPDEPLDGFYDSFQGRIAGANGENLYIRAGGWRAAGRLTIGASFPRCKDGLSHASDGMHEEITVSDTKPAEKVAADIRRRLLPQYLENLATVKERIAKHEKAQDYRRTVSERIAAAMEVPFKENVHGPRDGNISIFGNGATPGLYRVNIDYSGTVQIDGRFPVETALAVIELIKARKEAAA